MEWRIFRKFWVLHFVLELKPKPTRKHLCRRGNHHVFQLTLHKGPIWRYLMSLWGRSPHFQVTSKYAHASTERFRKCMPCGNKCKTKRPFWAMGGRGTHAFFFNNNAKKCVESLLIIWTILTNQIVESSQNVLATAPPSHPPNNQNKTNSYY
jgi:hypothetical protein